MRRLLPAACLTSLALAASTFAMAQAPAAPLEVPLDSTVRVGFIGAARDVVVGNPAIADVTILDSGSAVILGKGYGQTTVTAFDAAGRTVFSRRVAVAPAGEDNRVTYFRGPTAANTYVCAERCQRMPERGTSSPAVP